MNSNIAASFDGEDKSVFHGSSLVALALRLLMQIIGSIMHRLKRLIDFHVGAGSDGLVIAGTTGESADTDANPSISELIARTVEIAATVGIPVIAGTGSNSTQQSIDLSLEVGTSDIAAYMAVVVPYYNKPTQEGIFRHYTAIADAIVNKPLHDVQRSRAARSLICSPRRSGDLAEHANIFGLSRKQRATSTGCVRFRRWLTTTSCYTAVTILRCVSNFIEAGWGRYCHGKR